MAAEQFSALSHNYDLMDSLERRAGSVGPLIGVSVKCRSRDGVQGVQELCRESGGGRPGVPVPNSPQYGLRGRKATLNLKSLSHSVSLSSELRSCVKVEVAPRP